MGVMGNTVRVAIVCDDKFSSTQLSRLLTEQGVDLAWVSVTGLTELIRLPRADRVLFLDAVESVIRLEKTKALPEWLKHAPKAVLATQPYSDSIRKDLQKLQVRIFEFASIRRRNPTFHSWLTRAVAPAKPHTARPSLVSGFNPKSVSVIAIGASTGGVEAIQKILPAFTPSCPPTLLVQHTKTENGSALAKLLDQFTSASVKAAQNQEPLQRGTIYLAGDRSRHLLLDRSRGMSVKLEAGPTVTGHRPSVDACFESVSELGRNVVGVLLTGMGEDGARSLGTIKRRGGWTITQDEATSLVYGMPKAAHEQGADCEQLPLQAIGHRLRQLSDAHRNR